MNEDRDNPETTDRYDVGANDELANEDGPTTFDASADLKAVIAFSNMADREEVSKTMVLPEQAYTGGPGAPQTPRAGMGALAQAHPPQAHPPQAHPPQAHPPQAHPAQARPAQARPAQAPLGGPPPAARSAPPAPAASPGDGPEGSGGFARVLISSALVTLLVVALLVGTGALIYALL